MTSIPWDENSFAFKHGFTVSDEMLTAIGCTVVCQSHIEMQFTMLISTFMNVDEDKVLALTSGMSFKNLSAALSSLVLQETGLQESAYKEFKALMGKLQQFEEFRNRVSHSVWANSTDFIPEKASRSKTTIRKNRGVEHEWEHVEISEISEALQSATDALLRLILLVSAIAGKPIEWPSS